MAPAASAGTTRQQRVTGKITNPYSFGHPLQAMLQNANGVVESVRVTGMADIEGHSPCYSFVENGQLVWESADKFRIIDSSVLPASLESLRALGDTLTSIDTGGGTSNR